MSQKDQSVDTTNPEPDVNEQPVDGTYTDQDQDIAPEETSAEDVSETEENTENQEEQTADVELLTKQVADLEIQLAESNQRLLRVQADYDNFRRRTKIEKAELLDSASARVLESLLPIIDNFERAIEAGASNQDVESLNKGVEMIYSQLQRLLEQEGMLPIEAVGQPFDPEIHQAVMQVESEEHEEGIVVEELQKGYSLNGKVIRPSMVKVSS